MNKNIKTEQPDTECGVCPKCGSGDLDYGALESIDMMIYYEYECESCGHDGKEWYNTEFCEME